VDLQRAAASERHPVLAPGGGKSDARDIAMSAIEEH
jgi:hypothetical protein